MFDIYALDERLIIETLTVMRIGLLISCLEIGGAQRMALRLFDCLDREGHEVFLLTTDATRGMPLHDDPERAAKLECRLVHLSALSIVLPTWRKILAAPGQFANLKRQLCQLEVETVISFEDRANIVNMLSRAPVRRILSIRHPMMSVLFLKGPVKRVLIDWTFRRYLHRVDRVTFNSSESMAEFQTHFGVPPERLRVIHNYCDHESLKQVVKQTAIPADYAGVFKHPTVIACGRFKPVKGFEQLIRAFSRVHEQLPDARLVILGDGPLMPALRELANRLGLSGHVVLPGFTQHPAAWLSRADVFVLSSLSEGFPNVLLESLALGTPVVASDCISGPREILAPATDVTQKAVEVELGEFGILTPPLPHVVHPPDTPLNEAESALAEATLRALRDDTLRSRYAELGYQRSLDFGVDNIRDLWLNLLETPASTAEEPSL